jgi:hypothetical protein
MTGPIATTRLRWLPSEQGGRKSLPLGPDYATTAYFDGEPVSSLFSVVFQFAEGAARPEMAADMRVLAADRLPDVVRRIVPGAKLVVTEGPRPVAQCEVVTVEPAPNGSVSIEHGG